MLGRRLTLITRVRGGSPLAVELHQVTGNIILLLGNYPVLHRCSCGSKSPLLLCLFFFSFFKKKTIYIFQGSALLAMYLKINTWIQEIHIYNFPASEICEISWAFGMGLSLNWQLDKEMSKIHEYTHRARYTGKVAAWAVWKQKGHSMLWCHLKSVLNP